VVEGVGLAGRIELLSYNMNGDAAHRRFIYEGDTSTHAQGTDPRMALGA